MSREIRFRVWDRPLKVMFEATEICTLHFNPLEISIYCPHEHSGSLLIEDDCVFMQYTGLKDKNGKEVYEGDILYNPHDRDGKYVVGWHGLDACFQLGGDAMLKKFQVHEFWEIIGNIHQHPNLLKGE